MLFVLVCMYDEHSLWTLHMGLPNSWVHGDEDVLLSGSLFFTQRNYICNGSLFVANVMSSCSHAAKFSESWTSFFGVGALCPILLAFKCLGWSYIGLAKAKATWQLTC